MTTPTLQLPPAQERYQGLAYDEWMQAMADAVAVEVAKKIRVERRDYRNMPIEMAPFYAWEIRALNWTAELGEAFERSSLEFARELNRLAGTEEGWFVLARSLGGFGTLSYVQDSTAPNYLGVDDDGKPIPGAVRNTGVELFFAPPLSLAANQVLLTHLAKVARIQTVPYTLDLVSVNILNRFVGREYHYGALHVEVSRILFGEEAAT